MPGARGSPQGCITCKKRKVACDRRRPVCSRCTKAGIECRGYEKASTFVNRDATNIHDSGRQALSSAYKTTGDGKYKSPHGHDSEDGRRRSPSTIDSSASAPTMQQQFRLLKQDVAITLRKGTVSKSLRDRQKLLGTSVIRAPMLGLLTHYYVAEGAALHQAELYNQICTVIDPSPVFDSAISAAALSRCGQLDNDQELIYQGTAQYVKTIQGLLTVLKHPEARLGDEILSICLLLSAYELMNGKDPYLTPWKNHMDGVGQLMQLRGPHRHQTSVGHEIFIHYRATACLQAIMSHKSSFLSQPEWLTIPFEVIPKNPFHVFIDIAYELASILESSDLAAENPNPQGQLTTRLEIESRCVKMRQDLETWFQGLLESYGGQAWTVVESTQLVPEDDHSGSVFEEYFNFDNLVIAQTVLSHWGCSIILLTTRLTNAAILASISPPSSLHSQPPPTSNAPPTAPDLSTTTIPQSLISHATNIAKSISYCLHPQHKTAGPILTVHPLHVAMQVFAKFGMNRELMWSEEVFGLVCKGGSPFRDVGEEKDGIGMGERGGSGKGGGRGREKGKEIGGEKGELPYQLHLPEFGKGALSLG